ncbi:helix-turn-helix domain-containing protein [Nocardia sp. NPDC051570]|uniref:helix-turn-helix domain-containing protein n=1 Tax=Nocardia sp. NPDC051570 TaxID=3364324 RepID=UPI0037B41948
MFSAARTAVAGTIVIVALSSVLSFSALSDVARRSGVSIPVLWPLIVDGLILVATFAVVAVQGSRYAWTMLGSGAAVSIAGNILDAVMPEGQMPHQIAAVVAAVPPVALVAVTHLTVHLARHASATRHAASPTDEAVQWEPAEPLAPLEYEPAEQWPAGYASASSVAPWYGYDAPRDACTYSDDAEAVAPAPMPEPPAPPVEPRSAEPDTDEIPALVDPTREPRDVAEDLMRDTDLSNYAIAERVGVSEATVRRWRKALLIGGVASRQ